MTKTGLVVGTPEYMSPEQLAGDKLDGRSDIYSLALVCFHMLTGTLPFQADTAQETMIKRLTDEPMPAADRRAPISRIPPGCRRCWTRRWRARRRSATRRVAKFADDVTGVVQLRRATRGAATPVTRAQPELEDRTQLLDSKQTKAQASLRKAAPKRSMIPMLAVAVVVLGAAGGG